MQVQNNVEKCIAFLQEDEDVLLNPVNESPTKAKSPYAKKMVLKRYIECIKLIGSSNLSATSWQYIAGVDCSVRTAYRWVRKAERLDYLPRLRPGSIGKCLDVLDEWIESFCNKSPDRTLNEYVSGLADIGIVVSYQQVAERLKKLGLTLKLASRVKKIKYSDINMDKYLAFIDEILKMDWNTLHFMDQTGVDTRNTGRKRSRSLKGTPANVEVDNVSGRHYTIQGICCCDPERESNFAYNIIIGADTFVEYEEFVFNLIESGYLKENDVVFMDNWSGYVGKQAEDLHKTILDTFGIFFVSLPAYSPELNCIELLWHHLKAHLRKYRRCVSDQELLFICTEFMDKINHEDVRKVQQHVKNVIKSL